MSVRLKRSDNQSRYTLRQVFTSSWNSSISILSRMTLPAIVSASSTLWLSSFILVISLALCQDHHPGCSSEQAELLNDDPDASRGPMEDLKMNKSHFFNWGKKRINLTKYLIQHNKNNAHWSNIISIDEPEDKEVLFLLGSIVLYDFSCLFMKTWVV